MTCLSHWWKERFRLRIRLPLCECRNLVSRAFFRLLSSVSSSLKSVRKKCCWQSFLRPLLESYIIPISALTINVFNGFKIALGSYDDSNGLREQGHYRCLGLGGCCLLSLSSQGTCPDAQPFITYIKLHVALVMVLLDLQYLV